MEPYTDVIFAAREQGASPAMSPKLSILYVTPCRLSTEFSIFSGMSFANPAMYLFIVSYLKRFSLYVSLKGLTVFVVLIRSSRRETSTTGLEKKNLSVCLSVVAKV